MDFSTLLMHLEAVMLKKIVANPQVVLVDGKMEVLKKHLIFYVHVVTLLLPRFGASRFTANETERLNFEAALWRGWGADRVGTLSMAVEPSKVESLSQRLWRGWGLDRFGMERLVEIFSAAEDELWSRFAEILSKAMKSSEVELLSQAPGDASIDPKNWAFDAFVFAERSNAADNVNCCGFAHCLSVLTRGSCWRFPSSADTGWRGLAVACEGVCIINAFPRPRLGAVLNTGVSLFTMLRLACRAERIGEFEFAPYKGRQRLTCFKGIMRFLQSLSRCMWWPS